MTLTEYLTRALNDDQWLYEDTCDIVVDDDSYVDDGLLSEIVSKFHEREERELLWRKLLDFLPEKSLSQNVFDYLLENKISLITLAHMNLDDKRLKKLVIYANEALFTLAKRYYSNEKYSVKNFIKFICDYNDDEILGQLRLLKPDSPKKEQILFYFYSQGEKHQAEIKTLLESRYLEITNDCSAIQKAYESNENLYNMALSRNIFTPIDILEALTKISGVEDASRIRANSRETLELKKFMTLHQL